MVLLRPLKRMLPLPKLVQLMWTSPRVSAGNTACEQRSVRVVSRLSRASGGNCLERSLILYRYLSHAGAQPRLVVGMARPEEYLGHVWVTVDGQPAPGDHRDAARIRNRHSFRPGRPEARMTHPSKLPPGRVGRPGRYVAADLVGRRPLFTHFDRPRQVLRPGDDRRARRPAAQPLGTPSAARTRRKGGFERREPRLDRVREVGRERDRASPRLVRDGDLRRRRSHSAGRARPARHVPALSHRRPDRVCSSRTPSMRSCSRTGSRTRSTCLSSSTISDTFGRSPTRPIRSRPQGAAWERAAAR